MRDINEIKVNQINEHVCNLGRKELEGDDAILVVACVLEPLDLLIHHAGEPSGVALCALPG